MKRLLITGLLSLFLFACHKGSEVGQNPETFCFDGTVRWMGEPAADGLGWVLYKGDSVSGETYL